MCACVWPWPEYEPLAVRVLFADPWASLCAEPGDAGACRLEGPGLGASLRPLSLSFLLLKGALDRVDIGGLVACGRKPADLAEGPCLGVWLAVQSCAWALWIS